VATRKAEVSLRLEGGMDQLWEGFGGGLSEMGWAALQAIRGGGRNRAVNVLFNPEEGCRFHYGRISVGASNLAHSPYSLNDTPGDLLMRQFSVARDEDAVLPYLRLPLERIRKFKVVACPWSPPEWMKKGGAGGGAGKLAWNPRMLEAYALYLARFVEGYRGAGIRVDHLLVQNDPASAERVPGCLWSGAQLRDFIRTYLGPMFHKRRISTRLWLGPLDSVHYADQALPVLSDPLAMQFVAGLAYQHDAEAMLVRVRRAFPETLLMQSDCGGGDGRNTWEQAHETFSVVQQAISHGACICLYENLVFMAGGRDLEGKGRNSLIVVDPATRVGALTPDYHVFRHFSCLVDRYAVRLGVTGAWAERAVAFYNENDESRVLVIQNPEREFRRVVLEDGDRLLALPLPPESFNTIVL
jgi:glucosylceramidase